MSNNVEIFENVRKARNGERVVILDGNSLKVDKIEDVVINEYIKLKDVLYVPEFNCNLVSLKRLSEDMDYAITYYSNVCVIQDPTERTLIGLGDHKDGVYYLRNTHGAQAMMVNKSKEEL